MLDGDLVPVQAADPGVDDPEAALAQDRPHLVLLLKLVRVRPEHLAHSSLQQTNTKNEANSKCRRSFMFTKYSPRNRDSGLSEIPVPESKVF